MKAFRILFRNIRDAFKSVFRNFSLSLASIACIVITLIVVSIAMVLSFNVNNFTNKVEKDVTIVAFLDRHITLDRIKDIEDELLLINNIETFTTQDKKDLALEMIEASEEYKVILERYIDETALNEIKAKIEMGEATEEDYNKAYQQMRESNPLSDTIEIKVTDIEFIDEVAKEIEEIKDVISVKYGEGLVEQLVSVFDVIKNISYGVVIALIIVTAFLISNTIKITIFSRKREIEIMRLVGASNLNIKIPFIFEGLFLGILGSIIPVIITIIGYESLYETISGRGVPVFIELIVPLPFTYFISLILLLIGVLVGMFGSWRAVKKHLKI